MLFEANSIICEGNDEKNLLHLKGFTKSVSRELCIRQLSDLLPATSVVAMTQPKSELAASLWLATLVIFNVSSRVSPLWSKWMLTSQGPSRRPTRHDNHHRFRPFFITVFGGICVQ